MAKPTIAAGYPKALLDFAVSKGADRSALIERAGICIGDLEDPDNRAPLADYLALFEAAIELTGEPALALQFGEAVRMQDISIVGLICEACETTAEVGPQLNRYARLVLDEDNGGSPDLISARMDEHGLWLEGPSDSFARHRHIAEAEVARLVCSIRAMFDAHPFFQDRPLPKAVRFTHAEPSYRAEYDRIFKAPVFFDSDRNALLTDPEFVFLKQPPINRYIFGVLSDRAEGLLKSLEGSKTMRGRVEHLLIPILHKGELGMDVVAKEMGISRQTLYRKLKAEGAEYKGVLDELRHTMALHFLNGNKASVSETAYLMGFSHPAAFSRAFKRWTGESPRSFRSGRRSTEEKAAVNT
jgi:AraC-like DNA-binding protein